jgi:hypothetical protein
MVDAELNGRVRVNNWRKTPSQVSTAGIWFDLAMSPGMPVPKYWFDAPSLVAKAISQSADGGIFHGANVSPSTKYLRKIMALASAVTALPLTLYLCDYLLYYPSCDDSTLDTQLTDNTVPLPRYADGAGVQMIAVNVAGRTGGQTFFVTYTNSDGVTGRTSQTITQSATAAIGTLISGSTASVATTFPFIGLQDGDTGVRAIESVTMNGADVGLFTLILVKPLAQMQIKEITAPYEKDFFLACGTVPEIKDDAYLNFLCLPRGSLAATVLMGYMQVIFN